MLAVGRKRSKNLRLPAGVMPRGGRWYWQPTTKRERDALKAKGLPRCIALGKADTRAAREKWAVVSGTIEAKDRPGTVAELLHLWQRDGLEKQPNGERRADSTIIKYGRSIPVLLERFGSSHYGRTNIEASRGEAIGTAAIQSFIAESPTPALANIHFAVLDNVFQHGIRVGRTTYNPCQDVVKNASAPRTREPMPWEVECLRALASPLLGLLMDYESITGWRISDILGLVRAQLTADGVKHRHQKRGKRQLWEWTPELRRIVAEAATLPGATQFPASPVFPGRRGKQISYTVFDEQWQGLKRRVNAEFIECSIPLSIDNLHFHDLRSKAHDDAEEAGLEGHEFLGNTAGVARRHYRRREQKVRPLR